MLRGVEEPVNCTSRRRVTRVLVGAAKIPPGVGRQRYFRELSLLEFGGLYDQPLKLAALNKWRVAAGDAALAVVAPRALAARGFAPGDELTAARDQLVGAVAALAPEVIVLRTPPEFTPSSRHRDALRRFLSSELPAELRAGAQFVWDPRGLWETGVARGLAEELGLIVAADPLANDPLGEGRAVVGPRAYVRLTGLGSARRQFSSDQLEELADEIADCERAWVVFANIDGYRDARRFADLVRQLATA
jgi:uncharacterized protein YecE (DUF72 family)